MNIYGVKDFNLRASRFDQELFFTVFLAKLNYPDKYRSSYKYTMEKGPKQITNNHYFLIFQQCFYPFRTISMWTYTVYHCVKLENIGKGENAGKQQVYSISSSPTARHFKALA